MKTAIKIAVIAIRYLPVSLFCWGVIQFVSAPVGVLADTPKQATYPYRRSPQVAGQIRQSVAKVQVTNPRLTQPPKNMGVPPFPGAKFVSGFQQQQGQFASTTVELRTKSSGDEVVQYYKDSLKKERWYFPDQPINTDKIKTLKAVSPDLSRTFFVQVIKGSSQNRVMETISVGPAPETKIQREAKSGTIIQSVMKTDKTTPGSTQSRGSMSSSSSSSSLIPSSSSSSSSSSSR